MSDTRALETLASAIADRSAVDWDAVLVEASGGDAVLIDRLRRIDSVASSYRSRSPVDEPESLRPGDRWGPLEIEAKIGEGSYGEVYRACDTRLDRVVALKLLRDAPADISDVVVQEGRLLARVRHANVVTVFGADHANGRTGLWMELIEGETLEERLSTHGPFSTTDIATIGRDVCRALSAVHAAGLLHRDIKAQNVIRETTGRVVLTDFGTGRDRVAAADHERPRTAGTPLYFAPELFEGSSCSVATEIYSVGVLLYHLATGGFPVQGATISDIRAAHRRARSTPIALARRDLPSRLSRIITRALAPVASERYESAAALGDALDATLNAEWRRRARVFTQAGLLASVVAALGWSMWPSPPSPPVQRFTESVSEEGIGRIAVSRDGGQFAYVTRVGDTDALVVRPQGEIAGSTVHTAKAIGQPFFSPDGTWIGFASGSSQIGLDRLVKIPVAGGTPIELCAIAGSAGARWRDDGSIVYASGGDLWMVSDAGGQPSRINLTRAEGESLADPDVLDDGAIVATQWRRGLPDRLVLVSKTGKVSVLEENAANGRYSPAGYLLFVRDHRAIMARRFDARRHRFIDAPVRIADAGFAGVFETSASGTLVYRTAPRDAHSGYAAGWASRGSTTVSQLAFPVDSYRPFAWRLSPDGTRVFLALPNPRHLADTNKHHSTVWIGDVRTGVLSQLTFDDTIPVAWSADSRSVTIKTPDGSLVRRSLDRTMPDQLLVDGKAGSFGNRGAWSPDGVSLVLQGDGQQNRIDLVSVLFSARDALGTTPPTVTNFAGSRFSEFSPVFSPDGRWVAYRSDDTGRSEIYIRPFPGPGASVQISADGGSDPRWQGSEIFYERSDGNGTPMIMAATVELPSTAMDAPRVVATRTALQSVHFERFDVSPDGRRFLLLYGKRLRPTQLSLTLNWPSLLADGVAGRLAK